MAARLPWTRVFLVAGLVAVVGLIFGSQALLRSFIHAYYQQEYRPEPVGPTQRGSPPPTARVPNVPVLAEPGVTAVTQVVRMMAAQQGRPASREAVDFALGSIWGATALPRRTGFTPGLDPVLGVLRGASALGFQRRYFTTDDADEAVTAWKTVIASGRPVLVALDRAMLMEARGVTPHTVLLIGYDEQGFEYLDPRCDDASKCVVGERPAGHPGLRVERRRLVLAVESLALVLQYPWSYQLTVFEPWPSPPPPLSELLAPNALALIGQKTNGPSMGSVLVADTAKALQRHGNDVVTPELTAGLAAAVHARRDAAAALSTLFPSQPELSVASERLDEASRHHAAALKALEAKEIEVAAEALLSASKSELAAGEAMLGALDGGR